MKLVYIDPFCSGFQITDCKTIKDVKKTLAKFGLTAKQCEGERIPWAFIDKDGKVTEGSEDFT